MGWQLAISDVRACGVIRAGAQPATAPSLHQDDYRCESPLIAGHVPRCMRLYGVAALEELWPCLGRAHPCLIWRRLIHEDLHPSRLYPPIRTCLECIRGLVLPHEGKCLSAFPPFQSL
jgi:hypothetical protein